MSGTQVSLLGIQVVRDAAGGRMAGSVLMGPGDLHGGVGQGGCWRRIGGSRSAVSQRHVTSWSKQETDRNVRSVLGTRLNILWRVPQVHVNLILGILYGPWIPSGVNPEQSQE